MFTRLELTNPNIIIDTSLPEGNNNYPNLLVSNPTYTHNINSSTDLQPGQASSAELSFSVKYIGYSGTQINKNTIIVFKTLQSCDNSWRTIGKFYVTDIYKNREEYQINAYDAVAHYFDKDVTLFVDSDTSTTPGGLLTNLCTYCGATKVQSPTLTVNFSMTINPKDLKAEGITGREILSYIAEVAGGYAYATPNGYIDIGRFGNEYDTPSISITDSDYEDLEISDVMCPRIDGVKVATSSGICEGYGRTTPTSEVVITYNPLFYLKNPGEITQDVKRIYTELYRINGYYSCSFKMFNDHLINAGDLISVDGKRVLVFNKVLSDSGCVISCTGGIERIPQSITINQKVQQNEANYKQLSESDYSHTTFVDFTNADVYIEDIYAAGLGYDGNPDNYSLLNVLNALLVEAGLRADTWEQEKSLTVWPGEKHSFNTNLNKNYYTYICYEDGHQITYPLYVNITYGSDNKYVITGQGVGETQIDFYANGNLVHTVVCHVVTGIIPQGVPYLAPYPTDMNYENVGLIRCTWGIYTWESNHDLNNDWVSWEILEDPSNIEITLRVATQPHSYPYIFTIYNIEHPDDPAATWYLDTI